MLSHSVDPLFSEYSALTSPGASVAIIKNGEVIYSKAYGMADLETRTPATTYTNYRLASVTKQFTAMALLMLVDKGGLTLDSRLTDVLPGAPTYLQEVKIRHLLNHTSGIVDYEDLIPESQTMPVLDKDVLSLLRSIDSVYFPPGAKFKYSNSGYSLLALVVESISGQSFAEFLKKNIFAPLGMNHTLAYQQGISTVDYQAYGYSHTDTGFVRTDQSVTSAVLGDGGIYSSVDDLFRWALALETRSLVQPSLFKEAHTPGRLSDGSSTTYGFGWYIEPYKDVPTFYHTGSTRGFRNAILRIPNQKLTIIILTNRNEGEPIEIARKVADLILREPAP
ncbi:MAG: serine hydrolase [Ignavibacteriales bacterium]|nr:serine hydrolase [Ignavibacteriales bacterium]